MPDEKQTPNKEAQPGEQQQSSPPVLSVTQGQSNDDHAEAKAVQQQRDNKKKETAKRARRRQWKLTEQRLAVWIPVIISALVFFLTCAGIFYSYQQWQTMERSLEVSERAFIVVTDISADFEKGTVRVTLENIGNVPTGTSPEIAIQVERHTPETGGTPSVTLEWNRYHFLTGFTEIPPRGIKTIADVPLKNFTAEDHRLLQATNQTLYVIAFLKYEDGFGNTRESDYAYRYIAPPHEGWASIIFYREEDLQKADEERRQRQRESPSGTPDP